MRAYEYVGEMKKYVASKKPAIVKIKNDYLESRIEDVGIVLDKIMAEDVTKATGLVCNGEFVRRFRNKQTPPIRSAYALLRNSPYKVYTPNRIEILMQGWGR